MAVIGVGYIPDDVCWYLADLILEHRIEDDPRNVIHINTHLIKADSPQEAHAKAMALGRSSRRRFRNTDGKLVRVLFRGLRQLNVIHEPLEDGVELTYEEAVGVAEGQLREWITPKKKLGVFAPIEPNTEGPNYAPAEIVKILEARLAKRHG